MHMSLSLWAAEMNHGPAIILSLSCPLSRSSALMSVCTTKVPLHVGYNTPWALFAHARQKTPLFFLLGICKKKKQWETVNLGLHESLRLSEYIWMLVGFAEWRPKQWLDNCAPGAGHPTVLLGHSPESSKFQSVSSDSLAASVSPEIPGAVKWSVIALCF